MSESIRHTTQFTSRYADVRRAARPGAREWTRHAALFILTALTAAWWGLTFAIPFDEVPEPVVASPATFIEYLLFIPRYYASAVGGIALHAHAHPEYIVEGVKFSASLLSILLAHEAGHYVACRRYGVDATLPFFIPMPPPFMAGTLGAFIKIKSPIPTRRALFDIGVAGPLAGFAVVVPVAVAALVTATPQTVAPSDGGLTIIFNDPPLLRLLAPLLGVEDLQNLAPNSFYFAAWIGLLVTSLNLLPVGQLDGGHATYALFGVRAHRRIGQVVFIAVVVLALAGWFLHGAPSGFLYAVLLFIMLRVRHPEAADGGAQTLGRARALVALITLAVFLLSFAPFPLTIR